MEQETCGNRYCNTNIPRRFEAFFVHMMIDFKRLAESERHVSFSMMAGSLLKWLEQIPECNNRQFRNMIVFLLFPDDFEHIFAGDKATRDRPEIHRKNQCRGQ